MRTLSTVAISITAFTILTSSVIARQPNVIVILADDLGHADISLHGSIEVETPSIDSLAKNGVRCTSGYVSGPYCSPTRAGLLTGRYQQRFGHEFNPALLRNGGKGQGLPVEEITLAERMKNAGYATALIGKWHLGEEEQFHPQKRGFGEFFGFLQGAHSYLASEDKNYGPIYRGREPVALDRYLTDTLAKEAGDFMARNHEKPFFLYLAFNAVHTPIHVPPDFKDKLEKIADPARRSYLQMVAGLDRAVGDLLAKLRALKLEDDTLIFFLSDNGGPIGKFAANGSRNEPLRGSKGDTWEGGVRVPFLVQWKGKLPAGARFEHPVIQLDIAATSLAAAGVEAKAEWKLDSANLLPYLEGKNKAAPHDALYWRFGSQMAIRSGDWKLVRPDRATRGEYKDIAKEAMLFNLMEDIGEKIDLAAKHPERVRDLQSRWDRWNATLADPRWPATVGGKPAKP